MELQGKLLIATQEMDNDEFEQAVVYICDYSDQGTIGLMINSPTDLSVMELLVKMDFMMADERSYQKDQLVLHGGPIAQERGFILHTSANVEFEHSLFVKDNLYLTTSSDVLDTLGKENSPEKFIVCLGCCAWYDGQLEKEIAKNMWLVAPANETILFETGYLDRWNAAYEQLGIDIFPARVGRA